MGYQIQQEQSSSDCFNCILASLELLVDDCCEQGLLLQLPTIASTPSKLTLEASMSNFQVGDGKQRCQWRMKHWFQQMSYKSHSPTTAVFNVGHRLPPMRWVALVRLGVKVAVLWSIGWVPQAQWKVPYETPQSDTSREEKSYIFKHLTFLKWQESSNCFGMFLLLWNGLILSCTQEIPGPQFHGELVNGHKAVPNGLNWHGCIVPCLAFPVSEQNAERLPALKPECSPAKVSWLKDLDIIEGWWAFATSLGPEMQRLPRSTHVKFKNKNLSSWVQFHEANLAKFTNVLTHLSLIKLITSNSRESWQTTVACSTKERVQEGLACCSSDSLRCLAKSSKTCHVFQVVPSTNDVLMHDCMMYTHR